MENKHVNAVVVGAGAGGGVIAKELAVGGLSVVLMERGEWPSYDKNANDELINQRIQELGSAFGPDWKKNPRVIVDKEGKKRTLDPSNGAYNHVAACVGSGTVSYGAMAWRFMEQDFKLKTLYGPVEGSTLDDWPITYDQLEPYYEKAEWEIGVSGDHTRNAFAPPQRKPYPMPAFEYNSEGEWLDKTCKKMGLHPFSIPMLRNSVPYNGRAACIRNRTCCGYACPVDAKNGTQNTVIPVAMSTGNCEVRTGCMVAEILVDDTGRATGVKYFDNDKNVYTQTADIVIVSGSAIETARLLLNSKSKQYPNGIGNSNDWVGRNLQGHAYCGAVGEFDWDILDMSGPGACMAISDYSHTKENGMGGVLCTEFYVLPYGFSKIHPRGKSWGKEHKDYQRENYRRLGRLHGPVQEIPVFDSRVQIDPEVVDYWGIPVPMLSGERHPLDKVHCDYVAAKAEEVLKQAGAKQTWLKRGGTGGPSGGQHQAGTCRMGKDPKTSVVDEYCRVHETPNVFIADGSVLVTNGGFNPVLTIMAVAYRTGEFIAQEWKKGNRFK